MMTRGRSGENDSPELHKQVIPEVEEKSSDNESSK